MNQDLNITLHYFLCFKMTHLMLQEGKQSHMCRWGLRCMMVSEKDFVLFYLQGIPLHLQIDTYEDLTNPDAEPVHRTFCQIKVFRDKVSKMLRVAAVVPRKESVKTKTFLLFRVRSERTKMNPKVQKRGFRNG